LYRNNNGVYSYDRRTAKVRFIRRRFKDYEPEFWEALVEEILNRMPSPLRRVNLQIELRAGAGGKGKDLGEHFVHGNKHIIHVVPGHSMKGTASTIAHELGHALHHVLGLKRSGKNEAGEFGWFWREQKNGPEVWYDYDKTPWNKRPWEQFAMRYEKHGIAAFEHLKSEGLVPESRSESHRKQVDLEMYGEAAPTMEELADLPPAKVREIFEYWQAKRKGLDP